MIRKLGVCIAVVMVAASQLVITAAPAMAKCHDANFIPSEYSVSEEEGVVRLRVRLGNGDGSSPGAEACTGSVEYTTEDGTAKAGEDYVHRSGRLVFHIHDTHEQWLPIGLINEDPIEPAEIFTVRLTGCAGSITVCNSRATITIKADEVPRSASPADKSSRSEQSGAQVARSPVPPSPVPMEQPQGSAPATPSSDPVPALSPPSGPYSLVGGTGEESGRKAPWAVAVVLVPAVLLAVALRLSRSRSGP